MKWKECVIFVLDVQWFFTGKLFQLDSLSEFGAANLQDKKLEVLSQEMREERPKRFALEVRIDSIESKIMTYRTFFFAERKVAKYNMKHVKPWWKPEKIALPPWRLGILSGNHPWSARGAFETSCRTRASLGIVGRKKANLAMLRCCSPLALPSASSSRI